VEQETFRRAVWGLSPGEVKQEIESLIDERDRALERAAQAEAAYTELRLQSAKQVEEASAEAAVVLGHSRNEATRIREAAVTEADRMRREGEVTAQRLVSEAEAEIAARMSEVEEREKQAAAAVESAKSRADEIIRFANSQAEKLRSEAYEILRSAEQRSQAADNEMRLKRLDAERAEADLIDKADDYSRRVHQEADRHWQTTQRRSEELRTQSEDLLRSSQARAQEISKDATDTARRLMEETMDQLTKISSEVGASMSVVSRVRRSLGDQLDRLEIAEGRSKAQETSILEPMRVALSRVQTDDDLSEDEDVSESEPIGDGEDTSGPVGTERSSDDSDEAPEDATENPDEVQGFRP